MYINPQYLNIHLTAVHDTECSKTEIFRQYCKFSTITLYSRSRYAIQYNLLTQ